jgi:hypothetical protein
MGIWGRWLPSQGSGSSCNLYFRLFIITTNLFVNVNVKQLRTDVALEFYYLFPNILGCCVPNSAIFKLIRMME